MAKKKILVALTIEELIRLMAALVTKPNREEKDELLFGRLEYYLRELEQGDEEDENG
jgi:hypothetical protein